MITPIKLAEILSSISNISEFMDEFLRLDDISGLEAFKNMKCYLEESISAAGSNRSYILSSSPEKLENVINISKPQLRGKILERRFKTIFNDLSDKEFKNETDYLLCSGERISNKTVMPKPNATHYSFKEFKFLEEVEAILCSIQYDGTKRRFALVPKMFISQFLGTDAHGPGSNSKTFKMSKSDFDIFAIPSIDDAYSSGTAISLSVCLKEQIVKLKAVYFSDNGIVITVDGKPIKGASDKIKSAKADDKKSS